MRIACWSCIRRGPGGERIVDVVPGGNELETQVRQGVRQTARTHSKSSVKCTGVYCM